MAGNPDLIIQTQIATNNPCYKTNQFIVPIELCLHSVGTPQESAEKFAKSWNNPERKVKNLCHGVISDKIAIVTLNCFDTPKKVRRAWHGGKCTYKGVTKSSNNTAIGWETTESSLIKYTGGANFVYDKKDLPQIVDFYNKVFNNAVEVFARLALFHGITDFSENTVYCHAEGYSYKHNSSNHGDVLHTFRQIPELGWSMDRFREEVAERYIELKAEEELQNMTQAEFESYLLKASPTTIDKLFQSYFDRLSKKSASAYAKEDLAWAKDNGLLVGSQGNQMPQMFTKREDLCAVLHRYHEEFVQTKRQ